MHKKSPYKYISLIAAFLLSMAAVTDMEAQKLPTSKDELHNSLYFSSRAEELQNANNWEASKREIDDGLKLYPEDPELLYLNGRYYYQAHRDLQKARYNLVKALQESDQHWGARRVLIDVEDESNHYSSAICYINELLEQQPYDRTLWRRKINLYNKMGNRTEANAALERLSRIYPNDTVLRHELSLLNRETWNRRINSTSLGEQAATLETYLNTDPYELDY